MRNFRVRCDRRKVMAETDNVGMTRPRIRVAAYVIRHRAVPELLVFDHIGMPEAGAQVPAGGVTSGEGLEEAVLREVAEETGLLTATVVRQIAVEDTPRPDTGEPRRTSFFYLQAPADTSNAWEWLYRAAATSLVDGLGRRPVPRMGDVCRRVWEALGFLPGQHRDAPGERCWSCRGCRRSSCTRRSGVTTVAACRCGSLLSASTV
ncbi:NUDIX domain-containing protein [Streptomyces kebangsaanensis]|uniref:NUDIX domain-containing protein n=1 Tax=Streptomyces kebangsaanensis TaxID=864058 RepID=UPI00389AD489